MNETLFYLFGGIAIAGALGMVLNLRNAVAGALSLVATMVSLGGIYVLLEAYLIGVLQILVYAGAIVVVFLFVVMLLNLRDDRFVSGRQWFTKSLGVGVGGVVLLQFLRLLPGAYGPPASLFRGLWRLPRSRDAAVHRLRPCLRSDLTAPPRCHGRFRGSREEGPGLRGTVDPHDRRSDCPVRHLVRHWHRRPPWFGAT